MKHMLVAVLSLLIMTHAQAEVTSVYLNTKEVPPLPLSVSVYVNHPDCPQCRDAFHRQLVKGGFVVVEDEDKAPITLFVGYGRITIPQGKGASLQYLGDVYGKGLSSIPPAVSVQGGSVTTGSVTGSGNLDAGVINEGVKLTGSAGGGVVVGVISSVLLGWIQNNQADVQRTPGVVRMGVAVRVRGEGSRQGVVVATTATTAETPETLVEGAFEAVAKALKHGIPAPGEKGGK